MRWRPDAEDSDQHISRLKRTPGVYLLWASGTPLHLSWSSNLERRLRRLLGGSRSEASSATRRFLKQVEGVECWPVGSRLETQIILYHLAKRYYPDKYLTLLKLRMPWFLRMTAKDSYPRLEVSNRTSGRAQLLLGPFVSRTAAAQYEQETSALFQLRRCTETLVPSSEHPGCIYGEMNQCLRPCQCAVTAEEYATEARRVSDFLATNGRSAAAVLSSARERACGAMEFEHAAQLHKRIEKIKETAALRDPAIGEIKKLNGLALTRAAAKGELMLWPMVAGGWQTPVPLDFLHKEPTGKSLDRELRDLVSGVLAAARPSLNQTEELAIFSRWYYSSWRDGEWFSFQELSDLNYRKLVREISKMAQGSAGQAG